MYTRKRMKLIGCNTAPTLILILVYRQVNLQRRLFMQLSILVLNIHLIYLLGLPVLVG